MRTRSLVIALMVGTLTVFAGGLMVSSASFVATIFPEVRYSQCVRLINGYADANNWPARGTEEYQQFSDCYFTVCGIRLETGGTSLADGHPPPRSDDSGGR
jgi:hypothetical protein